jgi:signal peptidase II
MLKAKPDSSSQGVEERMGKASWYWYGLALVMIILDQLTKAWMTTNLHYGETITLTSFFNFTLLHNTGAAFSFLSEAGGWQRWFFGAVAGVVSVALVIWIARLPRKNVWEACALALILGGAVGNLYDRVMLGYVVDFIVLHYERYAWPAFNIADSAICVGAAMLIIDMFRAPRKTA